MRLATEQEVINLMGAVDNDGSRHNAGVALDVTSQVVSEKIGTPLYAATYTDFFGYSIATYRKTFTPFLIRATAGFIDPATVSVRESPNGERLTDGNTGVLVDPKDYILDPTKGTFTLLRDVAEGVGTLTLQYDAGFPESEGVLSGIPAWLAEAGRLSAVRLLQMNPANFVARKALIMKDVQNAFMGEVSQILNAHIRPRMGYTWPDWFTSEQ